MKTDGSRRIAERYVRALFEVAKDSSSLQQVEKDLHSLAQALRESREFYELLNNPLIPRSHQVDAMLSIAAKMRISQTTRQFLAMLAQHRRLALLPEVVALFAEWAASERGEMTAHIVSATSLTPEDKDRLAQQLGKAYKKNVRLEVEQDPSLLGGFIITIGSLQLDGSLSGKMRRLKQTLQAS